LQDYQLGAETKEAFDSNKIPETTPFAYWSRLVVHPSFRKTNAMRLLDRARKQYIFENNIKFRHMLCCKK